VTDASGNTYVVGSRAFGSAAAGVNPPQDAFVAKLDQAGGTVFLATFSGNGSDAGSAIAVDPAGNVYAAGTTSSTDFPLRNPLQNSLIAGAQYLTVYANGFLLKLSPDGSQLQYSTYFGGTVNALAADSAGNVYATGLTDYRDFPATAGMPNGPISGIESVGGVIAAFVAKLSAAGDQILYAGRISGNAVACGCCSSCFLSIRSIEGVAIAVDAAGNAYVGGNANVTDLPTTPGVLSPAGIGAWVARVNALGTKLDYLTYLGAANYIIAPYADPGNRVSGLAVDAAGNAYIAGGTSDPAFPATAGAFQSKYNGPAQPPPYPAPPSDAFAAKLNPQGTAMVWATFLGGSDADAATAIALDSTGAVYVAGTTSSSDFPLTTGPAQGGDFVAALNPAGSALTFSARFPGGTVSHTIAADAGGRLRMADPAGVVSSLTLTQPLPARIFSIGNAAGGSFSAAVAPFEAVSLYGTGLGSGNPSSGQAGSSGQMPFTLAGTQVLFDGVAAPLLYVSPTQVNAVAPRGLSGKSSQVQVVVGGGTSLAYPCTVVPYQPAIFVNSGASQDGPTAAAVNQDGTPNSASNPAGFGSIVTIWTTGLGYPYAASPAPADGQVATVAQDYGGVGVLVNNESAEVLYAGAAPGLVAGVVQIDFRLPDGLSPTIQYVTIGLIPYSPTAIVYVAP
jgi:uncharacterized protein (TIGR03437 family)